MKIFLVTFLVGVLFLKLAFHHLSVSADEQEVGIQLRDLSLYENSVAQICFHHVDNWKETVMFRSRYKRSQLWGSPVVFFSLFSVVVPDMHKKGRFWAFHFVIDYAVVLPLQLQQVTFQTDPHSSSVCVLTFFYLCRNYPHIWYGNTAYRTQEENVWGCDKMICPVFDITSSTKWFWR